jgi:hypothetical protein
MDDDQFVSANEWNIFRHYVAAFLVTNAGPTMAPADGRPLADGPYGKPQPRTLDPTRNLETEGFPNPEP